MRRLLLSLSTAALAGQLLLGAFPTTLEAANKYLIFAVFPDGCDAICESYKRAIAASGLSADIVLRESSPDELAQADGAPAAIVQQARAMKADLVIAAGSQAALALAGRAAEQGDRRYLQDIPVIFTGVADPLEEGLVVGTDGSGRPNVAGSAALAPLQRTLEAIRRFDPDLPRLGYLYNANESQALEALDDLNRLAETQGFRLIALDIEPGTSAAPDPALIPVRLAELAQMGVTWVYIGASPTLRSASASVAAAAAENGLAIVSGEGGLPEVERALLTMAAQPDALGQSAAEQTLAILRLGVRPGELPLAETQAFIPLVNLDLAARLMPAPEDSDVALSGPVGY